MSITILSWDIGVSNLSYCLLQYKDDEKNIVTKSKTCVNNIISNDKFINLKDITIDDIGNKTTIKHWGILDISGNIDDCSQDNYTFFSNLEDLKAKNRDSDNDDIEITMKQMKGLGKKNIIMDAENEIESKTESKTENKTKTKTKTEKKNKTKNKKETKTEKKNKTKNKKETKTKKDNQKNNKDKKTKSKAKPNKKKYDVNVISVILFKKLDELMADITRNTDINSDMIDYILIENQPSLKNPKMKTIQVLVYSYFMIRTKIDVVDTDNINNSIDDTDNMITTPNIQFISALGKLKYCKDEEIEKMFNHLKSKYTIRKKKGIEYCKLYMGDKDIPNNNFFESNKKKDDLADSYLQAIQFMFKTKK